MTRQNIPSYIPDLKDKMSKMLSLLENEEILLSSHQRQYQKIKLLVEEKTILLNDYQELCQIALQDPLLKKLPKEEKSEIKTLNDQIVKKLEGNHDILKNVIASQDRMMGLFLKVIEKNQTPSSFYNQLGAKEKGSVKVMAIAVNIKG